jgi:dipeptidyl aminopeptidase/acylaminoacyl peptidase
VKGDDWGVVDYADVTAVVDAALGRYDRLDAGRMGVMGGSYGGFMAAWIIGQEDRWKSAVVERALISWTSFAGTSDIGGVFPENYLEASYPEAWDTWWQRGPLALAHNVTTPTLVLHAENDFRCPIEQAEQYFMALLRNGTTTEFIRFPDEGHEMSRSGKPRHRKERFEAILDWHDRHLQ